MNTCIKQKVQSSLITFVCFLSVPQTMEVQHTSEIFDPCPKNDQQQISLLPITSLIKRTLLLNLRDSLSNNSKFFNKLSSELLQFKNAVYYHGIKMGGGCKMNTLLLDFLEPSENFISIKKVTLDLPCVRILVVVAIAYQLHHRLQEQKKKKLIFHISINPNIFVSINFVQAKNTNDQCFNIEKQYQ